jgi:hypothetical protein
MRTKIGYIIAGYGFVRAYRILPKSERCLGHGAVQIGSLGMPTTEDRNSVAQRQATFQEFHEQNCQKLSNMCKRDVYEFCNGYYYNK